MWILEALSQTKLKKPFLIFIPMLGAAFLLLAFLSIDPLNQPFTYSLTALCAALSWPNKKLIARTAIAVVLAFFSSMFLLNYALLFAATFSLLAGLLLFPETFRIWKWAASSVIFYATLPIVSVWQQMIFLNSYVPAAMLPLAYACIFSFCLICAFVVYTLEKDHVEQAFDHYQWKSKGEGSLLAGQTKEMYQQLKGQLPAEQLQEFAEKIIHLCFQLQGLSLEIGRVNGSALEEQITDLEKRLEVARDKVAIRQYEQALLNKKRQKEHQQGLQTQFERIRAQILNYISALENIRLAYANRDFKNTSDNREAIEFFMEMAKMQAENVSEKAEAYETLTAN